MANGAGGATIGALRVVLGADTAEFETGLKSAQSKLTSFGRSIANASAVAATAFAAVGVAAAVAIKGVLNDADKIGKLSQSIGVPVESLSKLKYAAGMADVSVEDLSTSMVTLSKNMVQVAGGGTGPATQAFKAMGISVTDASGKVKAADSVLGEIADKFKIYQDGANKTALAVALFGHAGAKMIPLLNAGRDGLKDSADEAERFGLVLSKDVTDNAERFNDNLRRIGSFGDGVATIIAARLAPTLENLSTIMVDAVKNSSALSVAITAVDATFKIVATSASILTSAFTLLGTNIATVASAVLSAAKGDFAKAYETLKSGALEMMKTAVGAAETVQRVWQGPSVWDEQAAAIARMNREVLAIGVAWLKVDAPAMAAAGAHRDAIERFIGSQQKRKASLQAELETMWMMTDAQEKRRIELEAEAVAQSNNIKLSDQQRAKIAEVAQSYGALALKVEEARKTFDFVRGAMDTVASTFTDVITGAKQGKEAFADMARSIIRDLVNMIVKMTLYRAVASIFQGSGLPGISGIFGLAAGGEVAHAATGGFIRGPGSSTSDSIPAMLSNGEFVVNAHAAKKFHGLLQAINESTIPHFATGGMVNLAHSPSVISGKSGGFGEVLT